MVKSPVGRLGLCHLSVDRLGVLLVLLMLVWPAFARSDNDPSAPCGTGTPATYPAAANPPNARTWRASEISPDWIPATCIEWASQRFTVLTALAGYFAFDGGADDLLARFGAQSTWRGIKYWSATNHRWTIFVTDAAAVDSIDHKQRRKDFSLLDLKAGEDLYFTQTDNRSSGAVIYRMRVTGIETDRFTVTIENVSAISSFVFVLFDVGDLKSTYIFERRSPTEWGYYSLSGAREGAMVIGNRQSSYLNRAMAIYRHLAGIPTDQEPPLAP
jgi:hypothetical protein